MTAIEAASPYFCARKGHVHDLDLLGTPSCAWPPSKRNHPSAESHSSLLMPVFSVALSDPVWTQVRAYATEIGSLEDVFMVRPFIGGMG